LNLQASGAVLKPELFDQLKRCIRDKHYRLRIKEFYWAKSRSALTAQKVECGMGGALPPLHSETAAQMTFGATVSRYTYSVDVNVNVK